MDDLPQRRNMTLRGGLLISMDPAGPAHDTCDVRIENGVITGLGHELDADIGSPDVDARGHLRPSTFSRPTPSQPAATTTDGLLVGGETP